MKESLKKVVLVVLFVALVPMAVSAQITTKKVTIPKGKTSTAITGVIVGDQTIDYEVTANEMQELKVSIKANINACYFNVLPPGSQGEAIFMGETEGNSFGGTLSLSGTYKIRVFMMRSSARKGTKVNYTLNITLK